MNDYLDDGAERSGTRIDATRTLGAYYLRPRLLSVGNLRPTKKDS
jgi:hypothetical protein